MSSGSDRTRGAVGEHSNFLLLSAEKMRHVCDRMGVVQLMKDSPTER